MTPDELITEADRLRDEASVFVFGNRVLAGKCVLRAFRLYRQAARLSVDPQRGRLFVLAAEAAEGLEDGRLVLATVWEACRGTPDYEATEALRVLWDCWRWKADYAPFPEPGPIGCLTLLDRTRPIPGQLELPIGGGI